MRLSDPLRRNFGILIAAALSQSSCTKPSPQTVLPQTPWTGLEEEGILPGKILVTPPNHVLHTVNVPSFTKWMMVQPGEKERLETPPLDLANSKPESERIIVYDWKSAPGQSIRIDQYGPISSKFFASLDRFQQTALSDKSKVEAANSELHNHFGSYNPETARWLTELTLSYQFIASLKEKIEKIEALPKASTGKLEVVEVKQLLCEGLFASFLPFSALQQITGFKSSESLALSLATIDEFTAKQINFSVKNAFSSLNDKETIDSLLSWAKEWKLVDQTTEKSIAQAPRAHQVQLRNLLKGRLFTEILLRQALSAHEKVWDSLCKKSPHSTPVEEPDKVGKGNLVCRHFAPILKVALDRLGIEAFLIYGRTENASQQRRLDIDIRHVFLYIPSLHSIAEATADSNPLMPVSAVVWKEQQTILKTASVDYVCERLCFSDQELNNAPDSANLLALKMIIKGGAFPDYWKTHSLFFLGGKLYIVNNQLRAKLSETPESAYVAIWSAPKEEGGATFDPEDTRFKPFMVKNGRSL